MSAVKAISADRVNWIALKLPSEALRDGGSDGGRDGGRSIGPPGETEVTDRQETNPGKKSDTSDFQEGSERGRL